MAVDEQHAVEVFVSGVYKGSFALSDVEEMAANGELDVSKTSFRCETLPQWFPLTTMLQVLQPEAPH